MQRAVVHVQSSGREEVTGANVLVAIFAERESHAAYFLQEQDMTRFDAVQLHQPRHRQAARHVGPPSPCAASTRMPAPETREEKKQPQDALDSLLRQPQQEGQGRPDRSR